MPEMRFIVRWPDGSEDECYSPSLVVKDYLQAGAVYPLADFLERSRTALTIASDRVQVKYGMPCSLAQRQLAQIEARGRIYAGTSDAAVTCTGFLE